MAASPRWKIMTPAGEYTASTKHIEEAACLMAFLGDGATIRDGHTRNRCIVWQEGHDGSAADSYDYVVEIVHGRSFED